MSLSLANFSFFSFIFQVVSCCVYEAFLFYLTNHERPIDWTATVLQRYVDERRSKDGQHIDFKVDAHRKNFIRKANRYAILNVNGTNFMAKLEKCERIFLHKIIQCTLRSGLSAKTSTKLS